MPLIGLGTGVNYLTRLLNALPLPNTITITNEPDAGTLTTATAGQTHAAILAQINEGTATTDGPGIVNITATLLGDSTDPVQGGQSITGVYLLYTATEAPSVPRNIVFDPVITVPVPDTTAPSFVSGSTDATGLVWGLTFDEAVSGTGDSANWTATAGGVGLTIDTVSITDTTAIEIVLTGTAPVSGETLLISYSGGDLADLAGNSVADITAQAVANNVPVAEPFTLTQNADNEAEINGANGTVTVTVTSPAIYADYDAGGGAGVFTFVTADLSSGPVNLVPPQITGAADVGENLTITPGLWVYDGNNTVPTFSYTEDGAGTISTLTYTIAAGDAGNNVTFTEQAVGVNGTRTADSAPVTVSGAAPSVGIGAMEIGSTFVVGGGIGQMTINSTFEVA